MTQTPIFTPAPPSVQHGEQEQRNNAHSDVPCPWCGAPVPLQIRGGSQRVYCSDKCRVTAWQDAHPRVPVQNSDKVSKREKVLERLGRGRATGLDLLKAGGGTRYGARVAENRALGWRILGPKPWKRRDGTLERETIERSADGFDQYELVRGD